METVNDVVIIGSGPAAHTAAIYLGRASIKPIMYEGFLAGGIAAGGQLTTTTIIENFPGFPSGIDGNELMLQMRKQSENNGATIITETISKVDLSSRPFKLWDENGKEILAKSLIIATGATARRMKVPGEDIYWQNGVSACAICDGAVPIFRNKVLMVVGGGDAAMEEAMHLTKFGSKIIILHRRDSFRASKAMQERVLNHPKVEVMWNSTLIELVGDGNLLNGAKVKNVVTGEEKVVPISGLFYAIGHAPNVQFLNGQLKLTPEGYIEVNETKTSVDGVFAAGDVCDKVYRQAIVAAGSGCKAALDCEKWLQTH
ncbi:thioredoxin reductase, putative [Entamoeba invadens IP1]|uniref:Thioredoxin reductase n=1 Tax=Entamoeba invadens TaxID=33085 RepID=S0AXP4_ENTIV|nr:thioredoxin reductase, putative [Entamoeba invadens IP1]BAN40285.1 thioredoxin reductase, putative [Entamoeba invadens]ELP93185.1 thioredoxin reductase, putative [Entamoeba invadens IP1]BAN40407.1 thioredoxin reductase, putative [Entamoeba invadens]BAN40693.1 thioredoxin reductase, putative [Entamoeba invadens]BAN40726.1 thioredoxin reductase, putative [Entamoeba invadens]|eukprot:XP_004259956.1 thioredoxin reductase, putative [Entamoeba invadens IP1]